MGIITVRYEMIVIRKPKYNVDYVTAKSLNIFANNTQALNTRIKTELCANKQKRTQSTGIWQKEYVH